MGRSFTRRGILKRTAGVAVGATGAVVLADGLASGAPRPGIRVGEVIRANSATVEVALDVGGTVTVPPVGFPQGWRLRPGDPVAVMNPKAHGGSDHAEPVVTTLTGRLDRGPGRQVNVAGTPVRMRRQTIQTGEVTGAGTSAEVFCINNRRDNSLTAVAIRFRD